MATILIIDDDSDFSEIISVLLTSAGHQVQAAQDGKLGLALCEHLAPSLVITDIIMPECDGMEVIGIIRRRYPGTRIVAISGGGWLAKENLLKWAHRAGADAVVPKPVPPDALLALVTDLLSEPVAGSAEAPVEGR